MWSKVHVVLRVGASHSKSALYLVGVHGSSASGDISSDVASKDYLIEGLCEFTGTSSSRYVTNLTSLLTIGIVKVEMFLICLCDLMWAHSHQLAKFGGHRDCGSKDITWSIYSRDLARPHYLRVIWLSGQESIKVSYHPVKFDSHRHCGSGNIMVLVCHNILQHHVTKGDKILH